VFTLLSTSDTDLLSARASDVGWRLGNPSRLDDAGIAALTDGAELVVVRILGVRRQYEELLAPLLAGPAPVVVLGGEALPDAELMELSTVPMGVATEAHGYLAQGGPDNLVQLHRFLSDTVLLTGEGFEPPVVAPDWGPLERESRGSGPRIAVLYYRAHHLAGNTAFVEDLCGAVEAAGGQALPVLRELAAQASRASLLDVLRTADALVVTVLAAGGSRPATAQAGGDDGAWDRRPAGLARRAGGPGSVPDPLAGGTGWPTTTASRRSDVGNQWRSRSSTAG
jgi:cobaltochelatase CobN